MRKILLLTATIICSYSIGQQYKGKVGINTRTPKASLDVEGNMKIEKQGMKEYVYPTPKPEDLSVLFRNKKTGILVAGKGTKAIYKLQYRIYTDEVSRDLERTGTENEKNYITKLYSYNTKIPYNKYYLMQTHSIFKIENPDGSIEVPALPPIFNDVEDGRNIHFFPLKRVRLAEHTPSTNQNYSTWFIHADYPRSQIKLTKEGQKAFWEITVLAIDKKYITETAESYKN